MSSQVTDPIEGAWAEHRPYLVNLAFRMLGDIGEAEDVVQEAFVRLVATDTESIDDARGWLIIVTSRLCLDQIRSARRRLTRPHDLEAIEFRLPGSGSSFVDPADQVTLDDRVRAALGVVLDRLTPAERVVFILHDIFTMPFDAIGEAVGRSAPACRQLASRARAKVDDAGSATELAQLSAEHRVIADQFIQACATGDLELLLDALDPAVSGWVDLIPGRVFVGSEQVGPNLLRFWSPPARLVALSTGPAPLLLGYIGADLQAVIELTIAHDRVSEIHVFTSPADMAKVSAALSG